MKEYKFYGCYKGFVFDNKDPEFLMRLRVEVPQVYGEESPEIWALPKGIFCGNNIGFVAIPNKEDAIWVSFEGGDPRFPIWEYGWFGRGEMPTAANNNNGKPTNTVLQTTSGHRIELDDKEGSEAHTCCHVAKQTRHVRTHDLINTKVLQRTICEVFNTLSIGPKSNV